MEQLGKLECQLFGKPTPSLQAKGTKGTKGTGAVAGGFHSEIAVACYKCGTCGRGAFVTTEVSKS